MIEKYLDGLRNMQPVDMIENATLFIILILALVMFCRSSSPLNKYFIPIACIMATVLRLVHWAHYGNEPEFMTPVVNIVSILM